MSAGLTRDEVLFRQRFLKAQGLYGGALDGIWGPKTETGSRAFEAATQANIANHIIDPRSAANIATLHLVAQRAAIAFLSQIKCLEWFPYEVKIISGTRTYAEQNALYQIGRRGIKGERKVTNAKGGQSNHNFGIAWDVGLFTSVGAYVTDDDPYLDLARRISVEDVEKGANWRSPDPPHYQLETGLSITTVRSRFERGLATYIGG